MPTLDGATMRRTLLEVVVEYEQRGPGFFQSRPVLNEVVRRLGIVRTSEQQALLTLFGDLFLQGVLAWGYDVMNADPPFLHLTERGRETLRHLSRDPANPPGYLAELSRRGGMNPIAASYLDEGLRTYNAACWKATAVMIGAGAESIVLELRDVLVTRLAVLGRSGVKDLSDWRTKRVLDAIQKELGPHKQLMDSGLAAAFDSFWPPFTQAIRSARNDAGHPSSITPVTPETVHAMLLIFPELLSLAQQLREWIENQMT